MITEYYLLLGSVLILFSIGFAKALDNLGVPTLILFLAIGILAGSEGIGGIVFDSAQGAQSVGIVALVFILFAGGLETDWGDVKPVTKQAFVLATLGVFLTALGVAVTLIYVFDFEPLLAFLVGSVISSTDAAAVFSVLRSKGVHLKRPLKPLLELESGSNDPMAVFLTIGFIQLILNPDQSWSSLIVLFFLQMGVGLLAGLGGGRLIVFLINRLKFSYDGIYPVFLLAAVACLFGATALVQGSGFLAVYVAGILIGNSVVVQKRSLTRFFDAFAWMSQITMFVTLGLLVNPSKILPVIPLGIAVSAVLMLFARPVSVFISLALTKYSLRMKTYIAWVGLRGSVPIILATFPLLAGVPNSELIFNLVFFIVLTSALLQGWTIPVVARWLKVDAPPEQQRVLPFEFVTDEKTEAEMVEYVIPFNSSAAGKSIVDLKLPTGTLVATVVRGSEFLVPSGSTTLEEGDTVLVLTTKENAPKVWGILAKPKSAE
jgi:cell volume regulation protein A